MEHPDEVRDVPTCMRCSFELPRPAETCHHDPCPFCGYPRPMGDCSDV